MKLIKKLIDKIRSSRSFLIAAAVHIVIFSLIGGMVIMKIPKKIEVFKSKIIPESRVEEAGGGKFEKDFKKMIEEIPTLVKKVPKIVKETILIEDVLAKAPEIKLPEITKDFGEMAEIDKEGFTGPMRGLGIFAGRGKGRRAEFQKRYGAPPEVKNAVLKALEFLYRNQKPDGSWEAGKGVKGVTALCSLAFSANGYTHKSSHKYGRTVRRAIEFVKKGAGRTFSENMYENAICTMMFADLYALTGDRILKKYITNSINAIIAAQKISKPPKLRGGWRYGFGSKDSDLSVSAWQIIALATAKESGAYNVPDTVFRNAAEFVKNCFSGGGFAYQPGRGPSFNMTASGVLSLIFCGYKRRSPTYGPMIQSGLNLLMTNYLPKRGKLGQFYGLYNATYAIFLDQGRAWRKWNPKIMLLIAAAQKPNGSWESKEWDVGVNYTTALGCLICSVYYRYIPE